MYTFIYAHAKCIRGCIIMIFRLFQPLNSLRDEKVPGTILTFFSPQSIYWPTILAVDMACDVVAHIECHELQLSHALWKDRRGCFEKPISTSSPQVQTIQLLYVYDYRYSWTYI